MLCALCFRLLVFGLWSLVFAIRGRFRSQVPPRSKAEDLKPKDPRPKAKGQRPKYKAQSTKTVFLLKLFQKPDVVLEKQADVVKFVHQRAHAIDAEAKSKTGKLFRIDAGCA